MLKNKISIFVIFIIFASFTGLVYAIPNPASTYCVELGYKSEIRTSPDGSQHGVCVFPDGTECDEWQYYCKCKPQGTGCWEDNFTCDFPCGEIPCKKAGESVLVSECCEGLKRIPPTIIYDDECNETDITGWTNICSDCGNGVCESWEDKCNCPEDCPKPVEEECQVDNDCAPLKYCPDGSSYRTSKCANGKCEGIGFPGGNPCFDEERGCTPGLDCSQNNTILYLSIGFVIVVFSIILWLKFLRKK